MVRPVGIAKGRLGLWWVAAVGLIVGVGIVVSGHVLRGGFTMVLALVLAGLLRLFVPSGRVGALAVRSRTYDVVVLFTLAAALAVILSSLDLKPR